MKNTTPWAVRGLSRLLVMVMALLVGLSPAAQTMAQSLDPTARGLAANAQSTISDRLLDFPIIIDGCEEAGLGAAAGAADQGYDVALMCSGSRVGGMLGGGVSQSDLNSTKSPWLVPPFATMLYTRLANAETVDFTYQAWHRANGVARPSSYDRQIKRILGEHPNIKVFYNRALISVEKNGLYPKALIYKNMRTGRMERYTTTRAIDGSYTGDLQQKMGLTVSIGRESTALYGESLAGVAAPGAWTNSQNIDPYVTPGNPASGLLFGINTPTTTTVGAGDGLVMGFGYRPFLTSTAGEKMACPAPSNYDASKYELLGREMAQDPTYFGNSTLGLTRLFQMYDLSFNGGTAMGPTYLKDVDFNSLGPISINYPNPAELKEYISASPERRAVIAENMKQWILGLFWFIDHDARVPAALKTAFDAYGCSNREWKATDGFAPTPYAREAARIVGDFVLTQGHITSFNNGLSNPIARAYYPIDSPIVQNFIPSGQSYPKTDGAVLFDLGLEAGAPIPWTVLLPKTTESLGTLHPGNPSVSQVVWRSIRMGPIELGMGYAAGVVAAMSLDQNVPVQNIDVSRLNRILNIDGLYDGLVITPDLTDGNTGTGLPGTGTSTRAVCVSTGTTPSNVTNRPHFLGSKGLSWAVGDVATKTCYPILKASGSYRVLFTYMSSSSAATNASIEVNVGGVANARTVNQQYPGGVGGFEEDLGTFYFRAGPSGTNYMSPDFIKLNVTGHDGLYRYGGIKLVPLSPNMTAVKPLSFNDRAPAANDNTPWLVDLAA